MSRDYSLMWCMLFCYACVILVCLCDTVTQTDKQSEKLSLILATQTLWSGNTRTRVKCFYLCAYVHVSWCLINSCPCVDNAWINLKVFRYSFFGTILNFLNRLLDSLALVRSTWNLPYFLVLGWTLAWFTFCENRYFRDNHKQKSSKTVKLKFCAIQISPWKANTNILNCSVWQTKYTRTKNTVTL